MASQVWTPVELAKLRGQLWVRLVHLRAVQDPEARQVEAALERLRQWQRERQGENNEPACY